MNLEPSTTEIMSKIFNIRSTTFSYERSTFIVKLQKLINFVRPILAYIASSKFNIKINRQYLFTLIIEYKILLDFKF